MRPIRRKFFPRSVLFSLIGPLLMPGIAHPQAWSGIVAPIRATDWTQVGVYGGIPTNWPTCTTAACNTLSSGTVNDTSIANAIASAPSQSVVVFPAGNFTISAFSVGRDNIILRGQGADQTKLVFTNTTSCGAGGGGVSSMICIGGSSNWVGSPNNQATWTAGFAKGTTVITLSAVPNLTVGGMIILIQNKDSAGYPTAVDALVCDNGNACTTEGASPVSFGGQTAFYRVQAISGTNVTIWPPLQAPNWRASQNPSAWWPNHAATGVGIENMTLDGSAGTGARTIIEFDNAIGNWVQGVRGIITAPTGDKGYHIHHYLAAQNTIRNNYFYGYRDTAQENYSVTVSGGDLLENNIIDQYVAPIVDNGPGTNGVVIAYNYMTNCVGLNGISGWTQGIFFHNISDFMSLVEGNDSPKINYDAIHGTHNFGTLFRNYLHGQASQTSNTQLVDIKTRARNMNVIGNVLGCGVATDCPGGSFPYWTTYEVDAANSSTAIFELGGPYNAATADAQVALDTMKWGNYDSVNAAVRFLGTEIPSALTNFANSVPTTQTLPASFYLSSRPSWWGASIPYPAVGPDVTGGNISGMGGHAFKVPARACYEKLASDPAYSGTNIKSFNANTCYGVLGPAPGAPFIVSAVVN